MIQEALEYLASQADEAATLQTIDAPGCSGRWAVVHRDGKVEWFDRQCGPRRHIAHSFDSFIRATIGIHEAGAQTWVFVPQRKEIVAIARLDKGDKPLDTVSMPVTVTDEYKLLSDTPKSYDQKGFLRALRVDLHRCAVQDLVALLAHVTFSHTDDGESAITTGKSSLTRKTVNELNSKGEGTDRQELPDTVTLKCHHLEEATKIMPEAPDVECLLAVDAGNDKPLSLVPHSGETARVADDTQDWIVKHLTEAFASTEGTQVFAGAPYE